MSDVLLATSFTICAPMFSSGSFSSISLATVTPSLVIVGDPNFLSRMTLRPFGPRVTFTASARLLTPRRIPCRDASPYTICFATACLLWFLVQLSVCRRGARAWLRADRAEPTGYLCSLFLGKRMTPDHG